MTNMCNRFLACLVLLMTVPLAGCVSETQRVDNSELVALNGAPPQVLQVPQQLQDLSGKLLRYHAKHGVLPKTLEALVGEQLISSAEYAELPDFVYHPLGLGKLPGERVVILVDAKVHIEGHAWCIVREPKSQPRTIQLDVTPISLAELEAAARRSR